MSERAFILTEMDTTRKYCSKIHHQRQAAGFTSVKYPLVSATLDRYFLPEFRELIEADCNIMTIEYDPEQENEVVLNTTTSDEQQEVYDKRVKSRKEAQQRKDDER